ncbi:hypothetical protein GCM10009789_56100 [Kribbella sancticallisti]|uniref:RDD domain-containing protein n=1 Tax=Kribbella sancticallisti TaxID=460087 RepID=A0ABN2E346_9ACTN
MSTPPTGPQDRPQDPGQPSQSPPGQPSQYPAQPSQSPSGQPSQYPAQPSPYPPGQPSQYPPAQYPPGQPNQPAQPGNFGLQPYNPGQPGYNPFKQQPAAPSGFGYGYAPPGQLADWPIRVGASVIDSLVPLPFFLVGIVPALVFSGDGGLSTTGVILLVVFYLLGLGAMIWNRIIRQGRTGQSLGKKFTGLKIVDERTGDTIGVGKTFGREVCSILFNYVCFLNVLWPLWDQKQQTWHDKVVSDLVIKL